MAKTHEELVQLAVDKAIKAFKKDTVTKLKGMIALLDPTTPKIVKQFCKDIITAVKE